MHHASKSSQFSVWAMGKGNQKRTKISFYFSFIRFSVIVIKKILKSNNRTRIRRSTDIISFGFFKMRTRIELAQPGRKRYRNDTWDYYSPKTDSEQNKDQKEKMRNKIDEKAAGRLLFHTILERWYKVKAFRRCTQMIFFDFNKNRRMKEHCTLHNTSMHIWGK